MLPDVKLAFDIVDNYFACDEPSAITDAWQTLKTAVLAQQTNNSQSDAMALLNEMALAYANGDIAMWFKSNFNSRVKPVIAQQHT